jgi:hypothetical protein
MYPQLKPDSKRTDQMRRVCHYGKVLRLGVLLGLTACSSLSYAPPHTSPFFVAEGEDAKFYRAAARSQDAELTRCAESQSCDRGHFTRGLIALFESRQAAMRHFKDVIAIAPKGHLATSSRSWLRLLRETPGSATPESLMAATTKRLVREMLEREFVARQKVEELRAQLRKSEDLSSQLAALKRIQQEIKERSRPIKTPTKISGARSARPPLIAY